MELNDIISKCAQKCGIGTCLYAEVDKANYLLDDVTDYPVVLRLFQGAVYESDSGLLGHVKRDVTLFFYDSLGDVEADTATEVAPMCERMLAKAIEYIAALREHGVDVVVRSYNPSVAQFDAILAGVRADLTISYKACEYVRRHDCCRENIQ